MFLNRTQLNTHTHTHTRQSSTERVISSLHGSLPVNPQQTQEENIHDLSGIRNRNPSNRAAADRTATGIGCYMTLLAANFAFSKLSSFILFYEFVF